MSEVKTTLVKEVLRDTDTPNTWKINFPRWLWFSARNRGYTWISTVFSNIFLKSYEYRLSFDRPVANFGFTFPFVVKTNSAGVKDVFIYGVNYTPRSKANYGTSFIVSGSDFHFKSATRYKLEGDVFNILKLFYTLPQLTSKNELFALTNAIRSADIYFYDTNLVHASVVCVCLLHPTFKDNLSISVSLIKDEGTAFVFTKRVFGDFDLSVIRTLSSRFSDKPYLEFNHNVLRKLSSEYLTVNKLHTDISSARTFSLFFVEKPDILTDLKAVRNLTAELLNRNHIQLNPLLKRPISSHFANRNKMLVGFATFINTEFLNSNQLNSHVLIDRLIIPHLTNKNKMEVGFVSNVSAEFLTSEILSSYILRERQITSQFANRNEMKIGFASYTNAEFLTSEQLNSHIFVERPVNPQIVNKNELKVGFSSYVEAEFLTYEKIDCAIDKSTLIESTFLSKDSLDVHGIANCFDTTWERFGGVWIGCEHWVELNSTIISAEFINYTQLEADFMMQKTIPAEFKSVNIIFADGWVISGACSDTSWQRFGGEWNRCGIWKL